MKSLTFRGVLATLTLASSIVITSAAGQNYEALLKKVPAPELPAKAAELLKKAPAKKQHETALALLEAISNLNPAATPAVVGALVQGNPALEPQITAEAIKLQPALATTIRAAASSNVNAANPFPNPGTDKGKGKKKGHYKNL